MPTAVNNQATTSSKNDDPAPVSKDAAAPLTSAQNMEKEKQSL